MSPQPPRGVVPAPHEGPQPYLQRPLTRVLGERTGKPFATLLDLHTVGDLLRHYPRRYVARGELTTLADLVVGEDVTVMASVRAVTSVPMRNRKGSVVKVVISDGVSEVDATFFAPKRYMEENLRRRLPPGRRALFAGKVGVFRDRRQLTHPETQVLDEDEAADGHELVRAEHYAEELLPIYPASAKLSSWKIQRAVRTLVDAPELMTLEDPLPDWVRERHSLMRLGAALHELHRPSDLAAVEEATRRMRYEEAFLLQVALAGRRAEVAAQPAVARSGGAGLLAEFDRRLPFALTEGQVAVGEEIRQDLARSHPMHRLLQGEVGSGKTLVALRAMLTVVDSGGQSALLAPTEVLAQQHFRSISQMLGDLAEGGLLAGHPDGTQIRLLTGSVSGPSRRSALDGAASGEAGIVIGTHALLQDQVEFADLGLVVVDEQHRFGVEQRDALRAKAERPPHVLVMTATPIPRTVAMTVFGDLDTSTLRELPLGRQPIVTHLVPAGRPQWVTRSWARVHEEVRKGHQAYVVCPRIGGDLPDEETSAPAADGPGTTASGTDEGEAPRPTASALEMLEQLRSEPELAGVRVEVLHGRLPAEVKEATMRDFVAGEIDVLVATTVVEVGVDVANATTMVVLDADRFGVSQLHQLRGRVGRGAAPGLCLLISPVEESSPAGERLRAVAQTLDGFRLAEVDLEHRREGDVLGAAQSGGRSSLRLLRVLQDVDVIAQAREDATAVVDADPVLVGYPALLDALVERLDTEQLDFLERG